MAEKLLTLAQRLERWNKLYAEDQSQLYQNPLVKILFDLGHHYLAQQTPDRGAILDMGSGIGYHVGFEKNTPQKLYICVDKDEQMLVKAKVNYPHVKTIQASCEDIPLPAGRVDAIIASHILEHVHDLERCLRECRRLLKPQGKLLVVLPTDPGWLWQLSTQFSPSRRRLLAAGLNYDEVMHHEHVNSFEKCDKLLRAHFTLIDRTFYPTHVPSHHFNLLACYTLLA